MKNTDLIDKFWQLNSVSPQKYSTIILYMYLLNYSDKFNQDVFEISLKKIQVHTQMAVNTIKSARNKLKELGLINYQTNHSSPTKYKIILDYSFESNNKVVENLKHDEDKLVEKKEIINIKNEVINNNIPSLNEFVEYAKSLPTYDDSIYEDVVKKYNTWVNNGWVNGYNKSIKNWKSQIEASLPFLKQNKNSSPLIPKINRPKRTYNE